ncbi:MAG: DEAD/DEAH box helicase [Caulobacteraceae bacterium]
MSDLPTDTTAVDTSAPETAAPEALTGFPGIPATLERALTAQGYKEPTPVQAAVLEEHAIGQDLLVSAQTGSGKTVAFGLAAAPTLLDGANRFGRADRPLALAIAPTRELAQQVAKELTWLYAETGAVVVSCVGGMDARREQRQLANGAHIVVGTPGRLRDHIERGHLDLKTLKVVVLDEADEMLDLGFREDLEFMLEAMPSSRRTLLFSATLARDIVSLAKRFQRDAVRIDTGGRNVPHADIEYRAIRVAPNEMERAVVNVLRDYEVPGALVFCNTREAVRRLHLSLQERGFNAVGLSGELSQRERDTALQALRDGRARVCIATDVAARGLDLPDLNLVIHYDLPTNQAGLLHRSGRTGRAGKKGTSVLIVPYTKRRKAEQLLMSANIQCAWSAAPSAEDIRAKDQARMVADPMFSEPPTEEDTVLATALLEGRTPVEIATALIRMQRARLPAPEEMFDDSRMGAMPERGERPQRDSGRDFGDSGDRGDRADFSDGSWFRLTVGRSKNADPKWLVPLICRLGHVTKREIGAIKIFDRESKFEITSEAAERFTQAVKATSDEEIRIEPTTAPSGSGAPPRRGPPRKEGGFGGKPSFGRKPSGGGNDFARKPSGGGGSYGAKPAAGGGGNFGEGPRGGKPARKPYTPKLDS